MIHLVRYLKSTFTRGIAYTPKPELGLECFVDADFAGGWTQADADNADNVLSRTVVPLDGAASCKVRLH